MTDKNREIADQLLQQLISDSKKVEQLREVSNLIEYKMIDKVLKQNPDFDAFKDQNLGFGQNDNSATSEYLNNSVVPMPVGYKNAASSLDADSLYSKIYLSQKHIRSGGHVSDEKVEVLKGAQIEMNTHIDSYTERLNGYANGDFKKGMVNPNEIQKNIDAGKKPFKTTSHLVKHLAFDSNGGIREVALDRIMGIQKDHASQIPINKDTAFAVVRGNPVTADSILVAVGDTLNQQTSGDSNQDPHKVHSTVDYFEAARLADILNVKDQDPQGQRLAVVSIDTRHFDSFLKNIRAVNPQSQMTFYTNSAQKRLYNVTPDGDKHVIPSVFVSAMQDQRQYSNDKVRQDANMIMVNPSNDSIAQQVQALREGVKKRHPNDENAQRQLFSSAKNALTDTLYETGNKISYHLREAFRGVDAERYAQSTADYQSRYDANLNTDNPVLTKQSHLLQPR